ELRDTDCISARVWDCFQKGVEEIIPLQSPHQEDFLKDFSGVGSLLNLPNHDHIVECSEAFLMACRTPGTKFACRSYRRSKLGFENWSTG
ncbi:hypothetical protein KI387_000382, partial [Taxus chinensis]